MLPYMSPKATTSTVRKAKSRGLQDSIWAHTSPRLSSSSNRHFNQKLTITTALPTTTVSAKTTSFRLPVPASFAELPTCGKLSPAQELGRYSRIVQRLKWKLPFLALGYRRAITAIPDALIGDLLHGPDGSFTAYFTTYLAGPVEADMMFKLDFFEFYMLLERALVHLLGVFGIVVSTGRDRHMLPSHNGYSHHAYHNNVLAALDVPNNPLYHCLGHGLVRRSLARAKDLRNRWKYTDDEVSGSAEAASGQGQNLPPLESYDIDSMLRAIFDGFDCGYAIAHDFVVSLNAEMHPVEYRNRLPGHLNFAEVNEEARRWDFMVEAMDWEAV